MKCVNHPNSTGHYVCAKCGSLVCVECAVSLDSSRTACRACVAASIDTTPLPDKKGKPKYVGRLHVILWAMVFPLPGLLHMYMGLMRRGLFFCLLFFAAIYVADVSYGFALALPVIFFYTFFDALGYRRLINAGEVPPDKIPELREIGLWAAKHPMLTMIIAAVAVVVMLDEHVIILIALFLAAAYFMSRKNNKEKT